MATKTLQFKPFVMPLKWRSFEDSAKWVTVGGGTNAQTGEGTGRHFQIDDKTGKILKGGGESMKGKTLKEAFNDPAKLSERQKTGRKIAEAGAKKHGGDEREYRNLGTKTGQSDHFANKYLKTGDIPEGHLRDAVDIVARAKKIPNLPNNIKAAIERIEDFKSPEWDSKSTSAKTLDVFAVQDYTKVLNDFLEKNEKTIQPPQAPAA